MAVLLLSSAVAFDMSTVESDEEGVIEVCGGGVAVGHWTWCPHERAAAVFRSARCARRLGSGLSCCVRVCVYPCSSCRMTCSLALSLACTLPCGGLRGRHTCSLACDSCVAPWQQAGC